MLKKFFVLKATTYTSYLKTSVYCVFFYERNVKTPQRLNVSILWIPPWGDWYLVSVSRPAWWILGIVLGLARKASWGEFPSRPNHPSSEKICQIDGKPSQALTNRTAPRIASREARRVIRFGLVCTQLCQRKVSHAYIPILFGLARPFVKPSNSWVGESAFSLCTHLCTRGTATAQKLETINAFQSKLSGEP